MPGDVLMLRAGDRLLLSFWARTHFEAELGQVRQGPGPGVKRADHDLTIGLAQRQRRSGVRTFVVNGADLIASAKQGDLKRALAK